jgi:hypothetical protein
MMAPGPLDNGPFSECFIRYSSFVLNKNVCGTVELCTIIITFAILYVKEYREAERGVDSNEGACMRGREICRLHLLLGSWTGSAEI